MDPGLFMMKRGQIFRFKINQSCTLEEFFPCQETNIKHQSLQEVRYLNERESTSTFLLSAVAQMAVKDVNDDTSILSNYKLVLGINDGKCEADVVMKRFIDIIKTKDNTRFRSTVGMLGPACSDTVEPIAGVSKHFRTVVISYSAEGSISSDNREDYPYFFRTIAENKQYK